MRCAGVPLCINHMVVTIASVEYNLSIITHKLDISAHVYDIFFLFRCGKLNPKVCTSISGLPCDIYVCIYICTRAHTHTGFLI